MIVTGLTESAIDTKLLVDQIRDETCGGLVVFEGITRSPSQGEEVAHLDYEAYESLAEQQLSVLAAQAQQRWSIAGLVAVHRTGQVAVGGVGVVVAVCTPHRGEAFAACEWLIDQIKTQVAIWKKETLLDGSSHWVGDSSSSQPR